MIDKSSFLAIAQPQEKHYNKKDNISPISAMPLIQSTLPGPSASNASGFFIVGTTLSKKITTARLIQTICATLVKARTLIVGKVPEEGF